MVQVHCTMQIVPAYMEAQLTTKLCCGKKEWSLWNKFGKALAPQQVTAVHRVALDC